MINEAKLDFWIQNNYNVLFIGKHGVGKTSAIVQAFDRAGLKWKYFSASTLDPWVDIVGVPKERIAADGSSYLDLVRPKEFANDEVQAIFFDEYNRSAKKIRNAVMELIQFKSINGKKFNNLKIVWAAINPEDNEQEYDVENLDPAQADRFQVHVEVPYLPSSKYFSDKYGVEKAEAAISWWKELPEAMKNEISPRRLDYALDIYEKQGDLHDVLPAKSNITKLRMELAAGPIQKQLAEAAKTPETAQKFISVENNYGSAISHIIKDQDLMAVFLPLIATEKLSSLLAVHDSVKNFMAKNMLKHSIFTKVIAEIIHANQSKKLAKQLKKLLTPAAKTAVDATAVSGATFSKTLKTLKTMRDDSTPYREKIYIQLKREFPPIPAKEDAIEALNILADKVISRTHPNTMGHLCPGVEKIISTCFTIIAKADSLANPTEVINHYSPGWSIFDERLARKIRFRPELLVKI